MMFMWCLFGKYGHTYWLGYCRILINIERRKGSWGPPPKAKSTSAEEERDRKGVFGDKTTAHGSTTQIIFVYGEGSGDIMLCLHLSIP